MKAEITIDNDDDFWFGPEDIDGNLSADFKSKEEAIRWIRSSLEWLGSNIVVSGSCEIQKNYIKFHRGNRVRCVEDRIEQLYAATYKSVDSFALPSGNWYFGWEIKTGSNRLK